VSIVTAEQIVFNVKGDAYRSLVPVDPSRVSNFSRTFRIMDGDVIVRQDAAPNSATSSTAISKERRDASQDLTRTIQERF